MAIYPPNTTDPKPGNYLWNWLGSSLKRFGAALSPYIDFPQPAPMYRARVSNFHPLIPFNIIINTNTVGTVTWNYDNVGTYSISFPNGFLTDESFITVTQQFNGLPGDIGRFLIYSINPFGNSITLKFYDATGIPSDTNSSSVYIEVI